MPTTKDKKKSKHKFLNIEMSSGTDSDDSEHELSYYAKDKVKLMKEILKLIKPKKIKSMAPDCIKNLDIVEINSMLLEELLGISNKRLQYIFNGENVDRETSSSDSEEEKHPVDVISLDDISDDDDIELCIDQSERDILESGLAKKNKKHKPHKIKTEAVGSVKSESYEKCKKECKKKSKKASESKKGSEDVKETDKDKLMSVLELLELQARARAIRSQLAIETGKKTSESVIDVDVKQEGSDSDAIIIESPRHKEIVITSTDSEDEFGTQLQVAHSQANLESLKENESGYSECTELAPQKRRKVQVEQTHNLKNDEVQRNRMDDASTSFASSTEKVNAVDLTGEKESEDSVAKKKEKLFAKLQKIKLMRNKAPAGNKCSSQENSYTTEGKKTSVTDFEKVDEEMVTACTSDKKTFNVINSEAGTLDLVADDSKVVEVNLSVSASKHTRDSVPEVVEKINTASPKILLQGTDRSFCDNDEIVINLDEEEMNGMEND